MNAALLSCGDSLKAFNPSWLAWFDTSCAVNRVIDHLPCEWWSAIDSTPTGKDAKPCNRPKLFTRGDQWPQWGRRHRDKFKGHKLHEELGGGHTSNETWSQFSATSALWLLGSMATRIDCWGCDMRGTADWDGIEKPNYTRNASRWAREQHYWHEAVYRLQSKGVEVIRHGLA